MTYILCGNIKTCRHPHFSLFNPKTMIFLSTIFLCYITVSTCHVLFDIRTCDGGCRKNQDCASKIKNSICVPVINQKCGLCLCAVGYKKRREGECVTIDEDEDVDLANAMSTEFTSKCRKDCEITSTTMVSAMKVDFEPNMIEMTKIDIRSTIIPSSRSRCPDIQSREISCPNVDGSIKTCYSGSCFRVDDEKSYCVCTHGRTGKLCQSKKVGDCSATLTMRHLDVAEVSDNLRFRHNKDPDHGLILTRHFAKSLNDCMKLCLWATSKQCRSINYGPLNKQMVCELITISADKSSKLLISDHGWKYVSDFV